MEIAQGWKLHVSTRTAMSAEALAEIAAVCGDLGVSFKYPLDPTVTQLLNGKLWPRGSSGKFVTIYPPTIALFHLVGDRLTKRLIGREGPYILSDRRWPGSKSVYYRYGGFSAMTRLRADGRSTYLISDDSGNVQPDDRMPYWNPPAWAEDPFPEPVADNAGDFLIADGRYRIDSALSFSNRGGVYLATETETDKTVVIKEARPNVELGAASIEAVEVLTKEARILAALADAPAFVDLVETFTCWEHSFLVEEHIDGDHLGRHIIKRNPIFSQETSPELLRAYLEEMRPLWLQIAQAIRAAHKRGIILGDLSFTNILVEDGHIRICDLETAVEEERDPLLGLTTPEMSDANASPRANDYYALGAIVVGSLMLLNGVMALDSEARARILRELAEDIGLTPELSAIIHQLMEMPETVISDPARLEHDIDRLTFETITKPGTAPRLSRPIVERFDAKRRRTLRRVARHTLDDACDYWLKTATTERRDRLFPSDLTVFETNPLSVAYGSMGVLYAIKRIAGTVPEDLLAWTLSKPVTPSTYPPGLYLGQAGIAWVLAELGELDRAASLLRETREANRAVERNGVMYGAAGYGMACLHLWQEGAGEDFLVEARAIGDHLHANVREAKGGFYWVEDDAIPVGYAHGASGIALFLLALARATDEANFATVGREALRFDLSLGVWEEDVFCGFPASLSIDDFKANSPVLHSYWESGSAGIGSVLASYLRHRFDDDLQKMLLPLVEETTRKYTAFPQLFVGGAGLGNFLLDAFVLTNNQEHLDRAWHVAEGVLLNRIQRKEGTVFPGAQARRESADFATGSAGVCLFLDRLLKMTSVKAPNFNFIPYIASVSAECRKFR